MVYVWHILIFIVTCMMTPSVLAANNAAAFMDRPWGAALVAMGSAWTGVTNRSDSLFQNPAGMATIDRIQMGVTSYSYMGADHATITAMYPSPLGVVGIGYVSAITEPARETRYDRDTRQYVETGRHFGYTGQGVLVSLARPVYSHIVAGITAKMVRENLYGYAASGYGMDVGMVVDLDTMWMTGRSLKWGVAVQNLIRPQLTWNTPSKSSAGMPRTLMSGISFMSHERLLVSMDVYQKENRDVDFAIGSEFKLHKQIPIRLGWNREQVSMGVGLLLANVTFDFSMLTSLNDDVEKMGSDLDEYRVSVTVVLGHDSAKPKQGVIKKPLSRAEMGAAMAKGIGFKLGDAMRSMDNILFVGVPEL